MINELLISVKLTIKFLKPLTTLTKSNNSQGLLVHVQEVVYNNKHNYNNLTHQGRFFTTA